MCGSARPRLTTSIIRQIRREQKAANGENRSKPPRRGKLAQPNGVLPLCFAGITEGDKNSWS